jgi:adenine-specific DNA-methyltransferase
MKRVLEHATDAESLVLDFFAGSGTMGEAVLRLNAEDGGARRFVLVQMPEDTPPDSTARSEGYEKISAITRDRIVRAGIAAGADHALRVLKLQEGCFVDESTPDNSGLFNLSPLTLRETSPEMDAVTAEVLLSEGVEVGSAWRRTKAGDADVVSADGVAVVQTLLLKDSEIDAVLAINPRVVVFLEDGFAGQDTLKVNAFTRARELGITMKTV